MSAKQVAVLFAELIISEDSRYEEKVTEFILLRRFAFHGWFRCCLQ